MDVKAKTDKDFEREVWLIWLIAFKVDDLAEWTVRNDSMKSTSGSLGWVCKSLHKGGPQIPNDVEIIFREKIWIED